MALQRIDKLLSAMGLCSRREAQAFAKNGKITVDGQICLDCSTKIDAEQQILCFCGEPIKYNKYVYIMLNKPTGVLSATQDACQKTVLDLLPKNYKAMGVFPVGRLDKDTSGLLLLTNDGKWAHKITSPKHRVDKVYEAHTDGTPTQEDILGFASGLTLKDGTVCLPAKLEILGENYVRVTVQEGKYHQVRRMLASCGTTVLSLKRCSEGGVALDESLEEGQWRELSMSEKQMLSQ